MAAVPLKMSFLRIPSSILRLIGYNFTVIDRSPVIAIIVWLNLILLVVILWSELCYVHANIHDVRHVTAGLAPLLCSLTSVAKLVTFELKRKEYNALVAELRRLWHQTYTASERTVLKDAYTADNRLSMPYMIATMTVAVLYLMFPIMRSLFEMHSVGKTQWDMPMRSIFVYDISVSPNYELTYAWFVQATGLVALSAVGIDTLFYAAAWNLAGHFTIIQQRFGSIPLHDGGEQSSRKPALGRLSPDFHQLVEYHGHIIRLAGRLSDAYQPIMLMQFLITSLLLCVIAYQLTLPNQQLVTFVIYSTFLLAICFQCFVYCYGGTTLQVASESMATAVYGCRWYEEHSRVQRGVLFCLMRAHRPVLIRATFFDANLPTFSGIISKTGSYVALLQSLSE